MEKGVGVGCEEAKAEQEKRESRWQRREQGMGVKWKREKQEKPLSCQCTEKKESQYLLQRGPGE